MLDNRSIENQDLAAQPVQAFRWTLSATSLRLPDDTTRDEWQAMAGALDMMEGAVNWWRGDHWNFGQRAYGDFASQEARDLLGESSGRTYNTWAEYGRVARAFEFPIRIGNLTWKHHQLLAVQAREDPPMAQRWLEWSATADAGKPISTGRLKRELQRAERRGLPPWDVPVLESGDAADIEGIELYAGDFRSELDNIPDGSVDAIVTDPPYPEEYLPLYADLAKFAARKLRPGGSLVVMVGQSYLDKLVALMAPHIRYHWTLAYLTPGGQAPQIWPRRVNAFWKPVLWFVQGEYDGEWVGDVVGSDTNDNDKRFHDWGQSESGMAALVERLTLPGELIVDPFLGGGTTGVVANRLGRRFIGADLDAANVALARDRLGQEVA